MVNIAHQRLFNQHIADAPFQNPADVVRWMGAVQAQDYAAAKWALALRSQNVSEADVDHAFNNGDMLRTHVMRPTWHFVAPEDIRWLLKLTAPRVHALNAHYYRKQGLDDAVFAKSREVITYALEGGKQLTRTELGAALKQAGITTDNLGLGLIMMWAELEAVICSGGRRGKQFTYALLEECVPKTRTLEHDEALAELARRYFTSHAPAQIPDFVWWSGLTVAEAKAGLEMNRGMLVEEVIGGKSYWRSLASLTIAEPPAVAYLLPAYDEYTIAYKDHSDILDPAYAKPSKFDLYGGVIVVDGQIAGFWKRTLNKGSVAIELKPFSTLMDRHRNAVTEAANRYGEFLKLPVVL